MDLVADSPPVPRGFLDRSSLTKPVPLRCTPLYNNFSPEDSERGKSTFSPKSSGSTINTENSAFKPIQSPILNEQSESQDTKSAPRTKVLSQRYKFRHRVRSFVTDSRITLSSPQLEYNDNFLRQNTVESETIRRARSLSFLQSCSYNNQSDGDSCCEDYPDLDVAEIEIN